MTGYNKRLGGYDVVSFIITCHLDDTGPIAPSLGHEL